MTSLLFRAVLPGVCVRCDRVYLPGEVLVRDPLGGWRCSCTGEPPPPPGRNRGELLALIRDAARKAA